MGITKRPRQPLVSMSEFLKVFRCGPLRDGGGWARSRPALENLGRRKPRGLGGNLWGKHRDLFAVEPPSIASELGRDVATIDR